MRDERLGEEHTLRVLVVVVRLGIVFVEDVRRNIGRMMRKNHFVDVVVVGV